MEPPRFTIAAICAALQGGDDSSAARWLSSGIALDVAYSCSVLFCLSVHAHVM